MSQKDFGKRMPGGRRGWKFSALVLCLAGSYGIAGCSGTVSGSGSAPASSPSSTPAPAISVAPSSIAFGSVAVGVTNTQTVTVSNGGNADLSISQATVTGTGLSLSGISVPLTVAAGKSSNFNVAFAPAATGSVSGTITLTSNAAGSPTAVTVSGSGVQNHSVALSWTGSTSTVTGYYVYRGSQSGGPYMRVNATPVTLTSYSDANLPGGQTLYYVTTAVDGSGVESLFSNQVTAVLP
ncbi:MAG: choice-of-anchor D domain-containing protein [Acidobacteriia bacterium]|nr:choice-of-anchor D domain-containing protein [Terriglobia bacterium]